MRKVYGLIVVFLVAAFLLTQNVERLSTFRIMGEKEARYISSKEDKKGINFSVDKIDKRKGYISLSGWACIQGLDSRDSTVDMVIKTMNKTYLIKTDTIKRLDVTEYFKREANYDNSGFHVVIDKKLLKNENYSICIYIKNKSDNKVVDAVKYVDIKNVPEI